MWGRGNHYKQKIIENSDKLVLPGVGAFHKAISNINKLGLKKVLIKHCNNKDKFFLGICLGMQLLFDRSYENGHFKGLGIIKGSINKIPGKKEKLKIPHVGWNKVKVINPKKSVLFTNIKDLSFFYFVHSYYACNKYNKNIIGSTKYGNFTFPSVVSLNNVYGIQFHAEKSSKNGLSLLKNFINL